MQPRIFDIEILKTPKVGEKRQCFCGICLITAMNKASHCPEMISTWKLDFFIPVTKNHYRSMNLGPI
jgi:hypothetical protein